MKQAVIKSLQEFRPVLFGREEIPEAIGLDLWRRYGSRVQVEFPTPLTDMQWRLTAQGWVGYIPITPDFGFRLEPKVPLLNLFRMLEYAYHLKSFHLLEGLTGCKTFQEFFERLASILARRTLDRSRRGFYRDYCARSESLPYVRGRLDIVHALTKPWDVALHCHFQEHTADVIDNRIIAWTLRRIARCGLCTERVLPNVRKAYRTLQRLVVLEPISPASCVGRLYHRLNQDYEVLHALCRLFLESVGPSHHEGDRQTLPFLVDMARLFELFVAEWLKVHLPPSVVVRVKEKTKVGATGELIFEIDLVLYALPTGRPLAVVDTKYKPHSKPSTSDVSQIVTYAHLKDCSEAVLVYPSAQVERFDIRVGDVRVRSVAYPLDDEIESSGQKFLAELLPCLGHGTTVIPRYTSLNTLDLATINDNTTK